MATAKDIVNLASSWIGKKEADGSHKSIIDIYNTQKPLPRGYLVKYTDDWCATTVSALAVQLECTDIIPPECSCPKMAQQFKAMGRFAAGSHKPKAGDVIFFDWNDNNSPDHVGIVESVSGNTITTIEGNYHNSVDRRRISVGYKYIHGFGLPAYDMEAKDGWQQDGKRWKYFENGKLVKNRWVKDSKDWCYLGSDGFMLTNAWVTDSKGWLFVGNDGRILHDTYANDTKGTRYIGPDGYMKA